MNFFFCLITTCQMLASVATMYPSSPIPKGDFAVISEAHTDSEFFEKALVAAEIDVQRFTAITSFWIKRAEGLIASEIKDFDSWRFSVPAIRSLSESVPGLAEHNATITAELLLDAHARRLHLRSRITKNEPISSANECSLRGTVGKSFTGDTLKELLSQDSAGSLFDFPLFPNLKVEDRPKDPVDGNFGLLCSKIRKSDREDSLWAGNVRRYFSLMKSLELVYQPYSSDLKYGDPKLLKLLCNAYELSSLALEDAFNDESQCYEDLLETYRSTRNELLEFRECIYSHLSPPFLDAIEKATATDQQISILEVADGLTPRLSKKLLSIVPFSDGLSDLQSARLDYLKRNSAEFKVQQLQRQTGNAFELVSAIEVGDGNHHVQFSNDGKKVVVVPAKLPPQVFSVDDGKHLFDLSPDSTWHHSFSEFQRSSLFAMDCPKNCVAFSRYEKGVGYSVSVYSLDDGKLLRSIKSEGRKPPQIYEVDNKLAVKSEGKLRFIKSVESGPIEIDLDGTINSVSSNGDLIIEQRSSGKIRFLNGGELAYLPISFPCYGSHSSNGNQYSESFNWLLLGSANSSHGSVPLGTNSGNCRYFGLRFGPIPGKFAARCVFSREIDILNRPIKMPFECQSLFFGLDENPPVLSYVPVKSGFSGDCKYIAENLYLGLFSNILVLTDVKNSRYSSGDLGSTGNILATDRWGKTAVFYPTPRKNKMQIIRLLHP